MAFDAFRRHLCPETSRVHSLLVALARQERTFRTSTDDASDEKPGVLSAAEQALVMGVFHRLMEHIARYELRKHATECKIFCGDAAIYRGQIMFDVGAGPARNLIGDDTLLLNDDDPPVCSDGEQILDSTMVKNDGESCGTGGQASGNVAARFFGWWSKLVDPDKSSAPTAMRALKREDDGHVDANTMELFRSSFYRFRDEFFVARVDQLGSLKNNISWRRQKFFCPCARRSRGGATIIVTMKPIVQQNVGIK